MARILSVYMFPNTFSSRTVRPFPHRDSRMPVVAASVSLAGWSAKRNQSQAAAL